MWTVNCIQAGINFCKKGLTEEYYNHNNYQIFDFFHHKTLPYSCSGSDSTNGSGTITPCLEPKLIDVSSFTVTSDAGILVE